MKENAALASNITQCHWGEECEVAVDKYKAWTRVEHIHLLHSRDACQEVRIPITYCN